MKLNRAYSTFTIKSVDESQGLIEGIASTPSTDRVGDIVVPGGAKFKLPLPLLWQHQSGKPIGLVTHVSVSEKGIGITAKIARGVAPFIDEAYALIKAGLVQGLSIGFRGIDSTTIKGSGGTQFNTWDWLELSAVTIPANAEASILAIKSADEMYMRANAEPNQRSGVVVYGSGIGGRHVDDPRQPEVRKGVVSYRKQYTR